MLLRSVVVIASALWLATPAFADGIFADDAHGACRNTGKGTTESALRKCCRDELISGGMFGPSDPALKKEVNKCVGMGTGGALPPKTSSSNSAQSPGAQDPGQPPQEQKKADCPTDGAASAIGGAFGGALGGAIGSAVDQAKCD